MLINTDQAADLLLKGEVIAVPTETVYGLAAVATNPEAIAKIFDIKKRPADNPLICHFYDIKQISAYVTTIPANTLELLQHFTPGPISFMLDLNGASPLRFATCGSQQVIARIPNHPLFLSIIKKCGLPVAAPSANTSGSVSPTSAEMVEADLGNKIPGIVDGGPCMIGIESTILDARAADSIQILRPGFIAANEIRKVLPHIEIISNGIKNEFITPGSRYRHYAPHTPISIVNQVDEVLAFPDCVLFLTLEALQSISRNHLKTFTEQRIELISIGSLSTIENIARSFYRLISSVDQLHVKKAFFLATDFGDSSLGRALQNRVAYIVGG
jgi:L-threonylcarbamoyladenylate synthase